MSNFIFIKNITYLYGFSFFFFSFNYIPLKVLFSSYFDFIFQKTLAYILLLIIFYYLIKIKLIY
jgi:hypothetical protein